jgi:hypothetical protein
MSDEPNWIFAPRSGPTLADVMSRLVEEFPGFRPRWEKHLALWKGEPAGNYIDIAEFAHFVVEELYASGEPGRVQHAFDLMEGWLANGDRGVSDLVIIGFLEDVQNIASWQTFGREAFVQFLGPKSRDAWNELERVWAGKNSLMDVIRAEQKGSRPE